jgi:nitrous oxide reductase
VEEESMNDKQPENLKRRGFLLAAGVGSAGAVAAVATGLGKESPAPVAVVTEAEKKGGYAETRHINNYYRTARV